RRRAPAQGDDARRPGAGGRVAVTAVVFDVGETLIDETTAWEEVADTAHVPRLTVMGILGGLAARGEHHSRLWELLELERLPVGIDLDSFYPDAHPALERLRGAGFLVGIAGNT